MRVSGATRTSLRSVFATEGSFVYFLRVVFEKTSENQMKGTTKKGWCVDVFPVSRKTCFLERQWAPRSFLTLRDFFYLFEQQFDSKICFVCQSLKSYWTLWNQVERPSDQRKKDLRDLWEPELHLSTPSADVTNSALLDMKNIPSITTILVSFNYPTWRKISSNMLAVCVRPMACLLKVPKLPK